MRLAKGFLIAILGLFTVVTLMSLLIPSKVMTAKAVVIHAPQQAIVAALNDFNNWKKWNPLFSKDSTHIKVSAPSYGINASASWGTADKINKFTIIENFPEGIKFTLTRPDENPVENSITVLPINESGSYQVEWKALTRLKWYPWEKFAGIFVSEITGPGYEAALNALKTFAETGNH